MTSLVAKSLFAGALAVTAFAVAPAQAQTHHLRHARMAANENYAMPPRSPLVFEGGQYVGADPDANIRLDLRRGAGPSDGGGA